MKEKKKIGLIPRLIIAIALGILVGQYLPEWVTKIAITISGLFGAFLNFIIPLMIIAFVSKGIADLSEGAGKLLGVTVGLAYASTLVAGSLSYVMSTNIFPSFIRPELAERVQEATANEVAPFFEIPLGAFIDVTAALVLAFMLGLTVSGLRTKGSGEIFYKAINEFNEIINLVLVKFVIPLLPFFIFGNFCNLSYSGSVFAILGIFWKIFLCIIALHLIYMVILFSISGGYTGRNPFKCLKEAIPAYLTAVGTQSSAATIPVNVACNRKIGVTRQIREFCIPLCATVHLSGSMITLTACVYTLLTMFNMDNSFGLLVKFIAILGVAMVAAPGAPGGAVMSALPFLPVVGIDSSGTLATILISLYLTQDSFGTAANVTGDNAISMAVEKIYYKHIIKKPIPEENFEEDARLEI
ncbi:MULTISPECIES: dicarboxylate/amino acid:cation symporter [Peptoniphilus]|uniref:dicarboxylate/amino acid:cation symporter n=1 Tax=Peptoniphilus TaxID=162289 RepID=UPI00028952C6|nr:MULTISPECIES: dicarboxylate/amino acid:cation symporter [Peptoniphilus]MBS6610480.1 dicarboxylate/amino acid:cation symporter [Peptoniphilus harei]MDU2109627.1 dicarboxylate/amino acid:cation symporter [Peptoniphilus lacydonensis]MDU3750509.1 dicarboxylate/amino acid:cation symporter [Peptoniphilus rhinitidis]MDU5377444.1 dicarboxylate/amino acid:cation symporter [Peptoniphilus lacydonensis]MDU5436261.1 dicarboxylate/amino acid:cation symporter [Peptoniphilus lacydonensis]